MKLFERNINWFILEMRYNSIGLSLKDLLELKRLVIEKTIQLEKRGEKL